MVDLGQLVDHDFYHMEHYHPLEPRRSSRYRKVNPNLLFSNPDRLKPNGDDWGLVRYPLEVLPYNGAVNEAACLKSPFEAPKFLLLVSLVGAQFIWDRLILSWRGAANALSAWCARWTRRAGIAWQTVRGESVIQWPRLLMTLWRQRRSRS